MEPYYEDGSVTIYHGDWRAVLGGLGQPVDAVVSDPPYGIRADEEQQARAGTQRGAALTVSRDYGVTQWDRDRPSDDDFARLLGLGVHHIFWGGHHFPLPPSPGWLVWDKMTGQNGYADCEMAWTDLRMATRLKRFRWMGMLQALPEERYHPTQKPLPIMRWCLGFLPRRGGVVLDPYMGSGTTLRAAKDLGFRAVGVEVQERYCEVAARRCAQEVLDLGEAA